MPAVYPHKQRGFQIRYTLYFPGGDRKVKYRFRDTKTEADALLRTVSILENGSRAGNLHPREVTEARHNDLLSEEEARLLTGGKRVEAYDLDRVYREYEKQSSVANTPEGHTVNMRRAAKLKAWLAQNPKDTKTKGIPYLRTTDINGYILGRREGILTYRHPVTGVVRKGGAAPKTIRHEVEILRQMIDIAVELGMADRNVAREVDVPVKNKKARRSFSPTEVKMYFAAADANRHLCHGYAYEVSLFFFYTGFRRSEGVYAEWSDYFPERKQIKIEAKEIGGKTVFTPKSGEAAIIDLPDRICAMLDAMPRKGRFIFGGDTPIPKNRIYKTVKELCARAGLDEKLSLHHIRHSYISFALKETSGDLAYVQQQARHSDPRTTRLYIHSTAESSPIKGIDLGEMDGVGQSLVIKTTRQRKIRESKGKTATG